MGFIGSLLAAILSLNIIMSNSTSSILHILISTAFFVSVLLFIYSNYRLIIKYIFPKIVIKSIVENQSYNEVLKVNMDDRKVYLSNIFRNALNINFLLQILFGFSMISPFIWPFLGIPQWDKSIIWIIYFLIFDVFSIIIFSTMLKDKTYTDIIFNNIHSMSTLRKEIPKSKKMKKFLIIVILLSGIFLIFSYLFFWFVLTSQFILFNFGYSLIMVGEEPFVHSIVFIITLYFINSLNEYIGHKYKCQILILKQEKYREIRRKLYESNHSSLDDLWAEFIANAPW